MSFSSEVKHEISNVEMDSCCERAMLSAFLHINSNLLIVNKQMQLQIEIENATIAKRMFSILKNRYDVEIELKVVKKQNLNKNNVYILRVLSQGIEILEDLGIYTSRGMRHTPSSVITVKPCCKQAYLGGAFLAGGSINAPTTPNYHLEIATVDDELAEFIKKLFEYQDINAKITKRRNKYVVYVKAADHIADFLKVTGAHVKTLEFEDVRIQRDFKNSLIRLDNCEVANEVKSIQAGNKQIDAIQKLIEHNRYNYLEPRLIQVADLRMQYPEASLNELIYEYEEIHGETISKSGLQHRFKKIIEIASKLD
ncbi:DNA-binding protein WhiA [Erysipelothrix inopinata]|uniref:Probable cell division protein WhiA n=1 Tax=Erysipelothrix inopinata TaxID=225084 RepID=A0A7G9RZX0_9FIRM|nr:DNA-binding protein WhiA [Erysipelothrix inopinata]QNN61145.1 DNA-binding protein WhiA [Erysipelothrix inopinata]